MANDDETESSRGLGASASRGAVATLLGQLLRLAVQLLGIVILARLLDPADYGLVAMVAVLVGFGEVFRDFGLSAAAVQARTLSRKERDNLFWMNTATGFLLAVLLFALAGLIAAFYGEARLVGLSQLLAFSFLIGGISTQFRADLNRRMKLGQLAAVEVAAQIVGLGVGVLLAVNGAEYWSLAWMQIAQAGSALLLLVVVTRWLPGGIHFDTPMKAFLKFGSGLAGSQVLSYVAKNVDSVIIGSTLGAASLGLYNRAFQLLTLPLNQLQAPSTRVALPTLSRLQDDPARYRTFLLHGQTIMVHLVGFILAFSAAQALPIFAIALGEDWLEAAPLFQILAFAGFFSMANYATYWVFLSKGLTQSNLIFSLITRPILIGIILFGSQWGLYGIAMAYSIGTGLMWPLSLLWLRRFSNAPVGSMLVNGLRAIGGYGFAGASSFFATFALDVDVPIAQCGIGLAAFLLARLLMCGVWPAFRRDITAILQTRRFLGR